jgi:hypothetical protein
MLRALEGVLCSVELMLTLPAQGFQPLSQLAQLRVQIFFAGH